MASKPKLKVVEPKVAMSTREKFIELAKGTAIAALGILVGKYVPPDAIAQIFAAFGL